MAGGYAYLGCGTRLVTSDVTDPTTPMIANEVILPRNGTRAVIHVADTLLYLAAGRFFVFSIADPAEPEIVSTVGWPDIDCAMDLAVVDTFVFIADHPCSEPSVTSRFDVVNVANPFQPEVVSTDTIGGGVYHMVKSNSDVFLSCGISGIVRFDVADPLSPQMTAC